MHHKSPGGLSVSGDFQGLLNEEGGSIQKGLAYLFTKILHNVDYQDTTGYVTFIQAFNCNFCIHY